jgi:O-antigen/teichoic acid export membrane protein
LDSKVIKNILIYGVGDFIVTGVTAFLFIPLYITYLSVEDYGIYNVLNNNLVIFTYVFQFGIISAFSRLYFLKKEQKSENKYTWTIIYAHFIYALILCGLIYLFRNYIFGVLSPSISNKNLLFYPVVMAFLTFIPSLYYIYLRIEGLAKVFVLYQILNVLIISSLILINVFFYSLNLYSVLISFVITNLILWVVLFYKFFRSFNLSFDYSALKETVKFAFPIFIGYIAYFLISKYSIVILQKHISLEKIALFSLAQQIASIPSLITIAIAKAAQPFLFASKTTEELKINAQKFDSGYKLIMIWIVGALILSADVLFVYFLPQAYYPIHNITKVLLFISLIYNFSIVENAILLYFMKSKTILLITVFGSLINVLLSHVLVIDFAVNGILISMFIAFSINFLLDRYFSAKHVRINYNFKAIVPSIAIILLYLVLSSSLFSIGNRLNFYLAASCFIVLSLLVLLPLKRKYNDFNTKEELN